MCNFLKLGFTISCVCELNSNDDWNIDHRRWSEWCLLNRGDHIKKKSWRNEKAKKGKNHLKITFSKIENWSTIQEYNFFAQKYTL